MKWTGQITRRGALIFKRQNGDTLFVNEDATLTTDYEKLTDGEEMFVRDLLSFLDMEVIIDAEIDRLIKELKYYKKMNPSDYRRLVSLQELQKMNYSN
jgi:hypothetical protein